MSTFQNARTKWQHLYASVVVRLHIEKPEYIINVDEKLGKKFMLIKLMINLTVLNGEIIEQEKIFHKKTCSFSTAEPPVSHDTVTVVQTISAAGRVSRQWTWCSMLHNRSSHQLPAIIRWKRIISLATTYPAAGERAIHGVHEPRILLPVYAVARGQDGRRSVSTDTMQFKRSCHHHSEGSAARIGE